MFSEGNPKSFNINISIISSTSSSTSRLEYKNSLIYLVRTVLRMYQYRFFISIEKGWCYWKDRNTSWTATDKTFSDNKPYSVFSFENNSSHFYIYLETWDWLIYIGDSIGPVFHFKLRPLCVCPVFHSSGDSQ